jgi:hypothetical protein
MLTKEFRKVTAPDEFSRWLPVAQATHLLLGLNRRIAELGGREKQSEAFILLI